MSSVQCLAHAKYSVNAVGPITHYHNKVSSCLCFLLFLLSQPTPIWLVLIFGSFIWVEVGSLPGLLGGSSCLHWRELAGCRLEKS